MNRSKKVVLEIGIFHVPLELVTAHKTHDTHFHLLHKNCGSRLNLVKKCPTHGLIPDDEVEKGVEISKGQHVTVNVQDFENEENGKIVLIKFVPRNSITEEMYEDLSYVNPGKNATDAYWLLSKGLSDVNVSLFGKFYYRGNEHLVTIFPRPSGQLIMWQLYFADEIKQPDLIVSKPLGIEHIALITTLVKKFSLKTSFSKLYDSTKDQTAERIQAFIAKHSQTPITGTVAKTPPAVLDLMAQLREAVEKAHTEEVNKL